MRILTADIGFGTTDILIYDDRLELENCPRLVFPSATQQVATAISAATKRGAAVVFDGVTMGGGPSSRALQRHLDAGLPFYASRAAALSFNDDLEKVAARGVMIDDNPASAAPAGAVTVTSADLDVPLLFRALDCLGVDRSFDMAALAVQDHGFAPGASNRRHRFSLWKSLLGPGGVIDDLAFREAAIPAEYTRMRAAASLLADTADVIVMDTGPAAINGIISSGAGFSITEGGLLLAANAGNGHTLAAIVAAGSILGLVEHHTSLLDADSFTRMIADFAAGELTSEAVLAGGGHGCIPPREPVALGVERPVVLTGPRRERFRGAGLELDFAAPRGDMMLTGCFGLVAACLRLAGDPSA